MIVDKIKSQRKLKTDRFGYDVLDIDLNDVAEFRILDIPPWTLKSPRYMYDLCIDTKENTDPLMFRTKFNEIKDHYSDFQFICTDGSKMDEKVAAAAITESETYTFRLPDNSPIFLLN